MNILIDIGHPAHVHLFKNLYFGLVRKKHKVYVTVREIKPAIDLLNNLYIPFILLGKKSDSIIKKGFEQIKFDLTLISILKKYKIDIAIGTPFNIAHAAKFTKTRSIILDDDDDEVQPLMTMFGHPFTDTVLSPDSIRNHRKVKSAIFYAGYHELAYLHPKRFVPDPSVLLDAGLKPKDPFFIMRFNVFKAHHDIGKKGLSLEQKLNLIEILKPYGRIFITTERKIEPELLKYQYTLSPEKIHHFLYYATMFLGDSQTMTSEAAILGTTSIKCNSFAKKLSVPNEIENNYGLCYSFSPDNFGILLNKIKYLIKQFKLKDEWQQRRKKMLSEKIDVTAFLIWFVENYPESAGIMKENPDYQWRFK